MIDSLLLREHKAMGGIMTGSGELAWTKQQVFDLLEIMTERKWIILGGDVLNKWKEYTYDSWHYESNYRIPLEANVKESINSCRRYVTEYSNKNGDDYLFVLVISDTFVEGAM